jgi:hypothetical protein
MQISPFVRTLGLLLVLGLPGFGGGCGGSGPLSQEDSEKLRASRKGLHKELKEEQKELAKRIGEEKQKQGVMRKAGRRAAGAR